MMNIAELPEVMPPYGVPEGLPRNKNGHVESSLIDSGMTHMVTVVVGYYQGVNVAHAPAE